MNIREISEIAKKFNDSKTDVNYVQKWINELEARASSSDSHYRGEIDFRYASGEEIPNPGFVGNPEGYKFTKDIYKRYHFQPEYYSVMQMFGALGYRSIRTAESVDPSSLSSLMNMVFEKRKNLEDRVMQLLGNINTVLKSLIAIIYELKELERNLYLYDELKDTDKDKAEAAELALKRVFLDNVDSRKGGASLSALSRSPTQSQGGPGFIDIMSVFYQVKSLKDVQNIDRNEQYKNILKNRYIEYEKWKEINGNDLKNRKSMLLQYLKSQMGSFNLYVDWCSTYLSLLAKMGLKTAKSADRYIEGASKPDIFENESFSVTAVGSKPIYAKEYDAEYVRLFKNKGPEIPIKVEPKSIAGNLISRGYEENKRSFIYDRIRKYGPLVILAIKLKMDFKEKPSKEAIQPPYEGTIYFNMFPYCFTPEEYYLYKKAHIANIQKTVFAAVDQAIFRSLSVIQADLDKYVKEADEEEEKRKKEKKPQKDYAFMDIYRAFKDDFSGISKSFSSISSTERHKASLSGEQAEIYEMLVNVKRFTPSDIRRALEMGLFIADKDAAYIYDESKRRAGLLNWKPPFSVN
ncbi:MAG: hypothetical protein OH338_01985 [Candidatus Parvarchaeota archaeon]|nr:hypothetical protein [Candidatus Parvarchaeota archaeon]MCW1294317.1 hypothetical protein [Candidatus Parvarchaeum tengchongense]MCW1295551.1 hypothetical protein [Candidatus Parvarchaeum tengchongense]MCW1298771.1 hypothetical protein [Candidatus Parvarchaeum tengchongense]MCW1312182.1 hypothetical protein [Candidatus Parvarchaeum tengchongense]